LQDKELSIDQVCFMGEARRHKWSKADH